MPETQSDSLGQIHGIRRSFTLPTKLNPQAQRGFSAPKSSDNAIFFHPSVKIVHFAPRALVPIPSSSAPPDSDYPVDTIETLPWRSATERTVATSPLRLERVHGLTVFLKCGNVVHAILKNSQCWCVDGVSKFVLRIRPLTYYRIELPHETDEDQKLVEDLKAALPTVLRYEVTPCPFKRAFTVELPEDAMAPRRKKAWKPKAPKEDMGSLVGNIQGSSVEMKSEWLDSVSTGEDTDGTTDDCVLTPEGTNSTTSEAVITEDQPLPSAKSVESTTQPMLIRRSVTETPQTFSSLLAKFDAVAISEEPLTTPNGNIMPDEKPVFTYPQPPLRKTSAPSSIAADELMTLPERDIGPIKNVSSPQYVHDTRVGSGHSKRDMKSRAAPITVSEFDQIQEHSTIHHAESLCEHNTSSTDNAKDLSAYSSRHISDNQDLSESRHPLRPELAIQPVTDEKIGSLAVGPESELERGSDQDSLLSTSSGSFHSAEHVSPVDSVSSHATPIECRHVAHDQTSFDNLGLNKAPSELELLEPRPGVNDSMRGFEVSPVRHGVAIDGTAAKLALPAEHTAEQGAPEPRSNSSQATLSPNPASASPTTDFSLMSFEFRRRAQATRERAVSPMPSAATIHQPTPSEEAVSLLSKALTLVLVPPIHLFIVLLHIAARIVVSPAVTSITNGPNSETRPVGKGPVAEDDFSFSLEREASSDREDYRIPKELDPWDLD